MYKLQLIPVMLFFCAATFVFPQSKPAWVDKPDSVYSRQRYVAAVGAGNSRSQAERNAFGNITGYFGQSVTSNISAVETYTEQVRNGKVDISSSVAAAQSVETTASMSSLIGAEIADTWRDGNTYYAIAVMEKSKCAVIYKNMLDANVALIDRMLKSVDAASFEAIAQYRLAASIADANSVFAVVLQLLGGANMAGSLKTGDDYRYEAEKAAGLIPVNVTVSGDSNNRIKGAFANVLKEQGFRTGNNNSRYTLVVTLTLSPQDFAGGNFIFTRFVLEANLTDKTNGTVLFPFTKTDRSGHSTQQQADERAIQDAVKLIQSDYGNALAEYLRGGQ